MNHYLTAVEAMREAREPAQTWGAQCLLCGRVLAKGGTNDDASTRLDLHLEIVHGIEVES